MASSLPLPLLALLLPGPRPPLDAHAPARPLASPCPLCLFLCLPCLLEQTPSTSSAFYACGVAAGLLALSPLFDVQPEQRHTATHPPCRSAPRCKSTRGQMSWSNERSWSKRIQGVGHMVARCGPTKVELIGLSTRPNGWVPRCVRRGEGSDKSPEHTGHRHSAEPTTGSSRSNCRNTPPLVLRLFSPPLTQMPPVISWGRRNRRRPCAWQERSTAVLRYGAGPQCPWPAMDCVGHEVRRVTRPDLPPRRPSCAPATATLR